MLTPLGVLQANNWLKLNHKQSMLAIATPAATDDNWKFQQQSNMSRPPPASVVPSVSLGTPHHSASRDGHASHQPSSAPMMPPSSSTGTVVPSAMPHSNGGSSSSPAKPLGRSKSRGGSVGGFVHGIVNGVQASLRNVGHKSVQSGTLGIFCIFFHMSIMSLKIYAYIYLFISAGINAHVACGSPCQWLSFRPPTTVKARPFQDQTIRLTYKL